MPIEQNAFITGADRGFGLAMTRRLAEDGWRVFAGSYLPDWDELPALAKAFPDRITIVKLDVASDDSVKAAAKRVSDAVDRLELVVNNAAIIGKHNDTPIGDKLDYNEILQVYNVNAVGALRVVEALLPLTDRGEMKRLCFVSSEAGSIERCERGSWFGYCMSKSALNMGVHILFNALRPRGYTFRLLHPGWMKTYMSGSKNMGAELEADEVAALVIPQFLTTWPDLDEDRLVMRDWRGREWPW
jgi:NAD(P)-dependent dehydrogenase (short-subunit alcohol dehydrogenase family)